MKKLSLLLSIAMLFTLGNTSAKPVTKITISADQVTSARDIEIFIENASNFGARPVTIIFDSSKGDFFYSADDRSINIYYSNVTLTSKNGARFTNCGDGVFFDALPANNITIEGITFICEGLGIAGGSEHRNVSIRRNTFTTGSYAVGMENAVDWRISDNHAQSSGTAIFIINSDNITVSRNSLEGSNGVFLDGSLNTRVRDNKISAAWQGIYLGWNASRNTIAANWITGVQVAGIAFAGGNEFNHVASNHITCASDVACQRVSIETTPLSPTNKVKGNKFSH